MNTSFVSIFALCATLLALPLVASTSIADDAAESKTHQCEDGNLKIKVLPPEDGVMEVHAATMVAKIFAGYAFGNAGTEFRITIEQGSSVQTTTYAATAEQALKQACRLLSKHGSEHNTAELTEQLRQLYAELED